MNSQNTLAGHASTFSFVNELSKHLKITKICSNDDLINCFEDKVYWNIIDVVTGTSTEEISIADIHTASDLGQDDWDSEVIGFQLANGSVGLIAYNPECKADQYNNQFTGTSCISMIYDTSGLKKPNTYTKDLRGVNSKLTNCAFKIGGTCFSQPFKAESYLTFDECQALKSTLGIEYCYANNAPHNRDTNYYAAAAKICGGADNFPTHSELCSVAEYLYNVDSCEEVSSISSIDGIHLDKDKLDALGIPLNTSIFTSENGYTGTGAFTFYQKNIFSAGSVNGAFYPHNYAICRL